MNIIISGKHLEVGEALRSHAVNFVEKNIIKYFHKAANAQVTISKQSDNFHTHITVNDGTGTHFLVNGDGDDIDPYKSVDKAIKRIEKQLERYKNRIKNHRKVKHSELKVEARKYIINDFDQQEEPEQDEVLLEQTELTIIAEKQLAVQVLSVKDAVMHMNLQNLPAMLFVNIASSKLSMVYNRVDKNIAWVDTSIDMSDSVKAK